MTVAVSRRVALSLVAPVGLVVALAGCQSSSSMSTGSSTPATSVQHSQGQHRPTKTPRSRTPQTPSSAPATEFNPPGDIPDNQVFVPYTPPNRLVTIHVPEGWARSRSGQTVTFTDKLNSVGLAVVDASTAPTVGSARRLEVPALAHSVSKFHLDGVTTTTRSAGKAVLVTYQQDSAPDPVTGKVVRDTVERYEFWKHGHEAVLTLSGPVGADNVDPWRIVSDSLTWK